MSKIKKLLLIHSEDKICFIAYKQDTPHPMDISNYHNFDTISSSFNFLFHFVGSPFKICRLGFLWENQLLYNSCLSTLSNRPSAMVPARRAFGMSYFFSLYFLRVSLAPVIAGWLGERTNDALPPLVFGSGIFAMIIPTVFVFALVRQYLNAAWKTPDQSSGGW